MLIDVQKWYGGQFLIKDQLSFQQSSKHKLKKTKEIFQNKNLFKNLYFCDFTHIASQPLTKFSKKKGMLMFSLGKLG